MQTQEKLALEDTVIDILNKAQRGLKLSAEELAERANLPIETVQALQHGEVSPEPLSRLAFVLNLHPASLIALSENRWMPQPVPTIEGFAMFTTVYGDMAVNAYLVWDPQTREAATFDTGSSCQPILMHLQEHSLQLNRIFITHNPYGSPSRPRTITSRQ